MYAFAALGLVTPQQVRHQKLYVPACENVTAKTSVFPAITVSWVPVAFRMKEWVLSPMLLSDASVMSIILKGTPTFALIWFGLQPAMVILRCASAWGMFWTGPLDGNVSHTPSTTSIAMGTSAIQFARLAP